MDPYGALDRGDLKWNTTRWQNLGRISETAYLEIGMIMIMTSRGSMSELGSAHCQYIEDPPKIRTTKREYDGNNSAIERGLQWEAKGLESQLEIEETVVLTT